MYENVSSLNASIYKPFIGFTGVIYTVDMLSKYQQSILDCTHMHNGNQHSNILELCATVNFCGKEAIYEHHMVPVLHHYEVWK